MPIEKDMHNGSTDSQINHAVETCTNQVQKFLDYLHDFDPELAPDEVISLAAAIINELPDAFTNDPEMLSSLKTGCEFIKTQRQPQENCDRS